jgi:hypothetical protein
MILRDVMVPGKHYKCDACTWDWISIAKKKPDCCPNPDCRSREWNGKKRRVRAKIVLPKPPKVKWCEEETDF